MKKLRFNKLGIEIEINTGEPNLFEINNADFFDIKEFKNCVRISHNGARIATVLKDSKIVISDVVAFQGAEVRAGDRVKVRALDNSRIIAGGRAEVYLEGQSTGYKWQRSRAKMNKLGDRVTVFNLN